MIGELEDLGTFDPEVFFQQTATFLDVETPQLRLGINNPCFSNIINTRRFAADVSQRQSARGTGGSQQTPTAL